MALALATGAGACVCANEPMGQRLDKADAAVVGRIVDRKETSVRGARESLFTVEVVQRVKGDLPRELVVRSPRGTDCDLIPAGAIPQKRDTGLLLTRSPDGVWLGSTCSIADPGELVAAGGAPRGGAIKVLVGLAILALVLLWSFRRLKRGSRPDLPRAPQA